MTTPIQSVAATPLVALIGPTNAGKSTLFNRLTGSPQSITAREESTTRDRVFGQADWQGQRFSVVDTGGLVDDFAPTKDESKQGISQKDNATLYQSVRDQMDAAIVEADLVLFIYDGRVGLRPAEQQFLDTLRGEKKIWLVANKIDTDKIDATTIDLDYLGWPTYSIAAATGRGVGDLADAICAALPTTASQTDDPTDQVIAIVGRPNVGKSTLLNALTDSDRSVVSPRAGTTRDVVTAPLSINNQHFVLADTAGVRRRGQVTVGVEKFSVKRSLAAITYATAVIVVVDAVEGTTRADLHLIYFANTLKKPVLVVFNKVDLLGDRPITFHHHIAKFDQLTISALTGANLAKIRHWLASKATQSN